MKTINLKFFYIFLSGCFIITNPTLGKCIQDFCRNTEEINNEEEKNDLLKKGNKNLIYLSIGNKIDINKILKKEEKGIKFLFDNLLFTNQQKLPKKSYQFSFDVESDTQYIINDTVYAEGNVAIFLPYGIFRAGKISFDRKNKIFKSFDNLEFDKGRQYFSADYLEYDLINNKGKIDNVYGIIDFALINSDLGLDLGIEDNFCDQEKVNLIDPPSEVELLSSSNVRLKNYTNLKSFSFNFSEINQWRFKSKRINFNNEKWYSNKIYFTNDPFNKAQFIVISEDFLAEIDSGKKKFTSKSTSINLDGKFKVPIGKRTIADSDVQSRWGFGYKNNDKDGFFISRDSDKISLGNNFNLNLKKYFLVQRAITVHTNSFRDKDSVVVSENIRSSIDFMDYFAMNAKLNGKYNKFILESKLDIKTLNKDKFYDAFSFDFNLKRNIFSYKNTKSNFNQNCKSSINSNREEGFDMDIGSYALYDKNDLYLAYGFKLLSNYYFKDEKIKNNYSLILDYGQFKGKSLLEENKLVDLIRVGYNLSLDHEYKLINFNKSRDIIDSEYKNIPKLFDQGIYINSKISSGFYQYSNGDNQNILSLSFGPSFVLGDLKRNYFDYLKLSVQPEFIIKDNQSPFRFDDFNNDSRVKLEIDKQLFGPLILGFNGNYNINSNSNSYGSLENKIYSLKLSRRAYAIDLSYFERDKAIAFGFEVFSFGYNTKSSKF